MSKSLRDQLLGLGYQPAPKPEPAPAPAPKKPTSFPPRERPVAGGSGKHGKSGNTSSTGKPADRAPRPAEAGRRRPSPPARTREEMDLAKAYALRAQKEKDDRIEAERIKQEEARVRREAKARLAVLLKDRALNDPAAEIARHFEYGGKIKRIHVTAEQLRALNAGELGVVQADGRYLLVSAALLAEAESIFSAAVALKVDAGAPASDDPYGDPAYQVPDDLVW